MHKHAPCVPSFTAPQPPRLLGILCVDMLSRRDGDDLSGDSYIPDTKDCVQLCKVI